jgi:diguanylate cyclase (GGDEF)-like protein
MVRGAHRGPRSVATAPVVHEERTRDVGASIGLAPITQDMREPSAWLAAADAACYEAKRAGRGVVRIARGAAELSRAHER